MRNIDDILYSTENSDDEIYSGRENSHNELDLEFLLNQDDDIIDIDEKYDVITEQLKTSEISTEILSLGVENMAVNRDENTQTLLREEVEIDNFIDSDDVTDNDQLSALEMAEKREIGYISFGKTDIVPLLQPSRPNNESNNNKYIDYKQNGPGIPTCIHVTLKYIIVGTSRGYILLFDNNQEVRHVLVSSPNPASTISNSAITAVDFQINSVFLICGNSLGTINLWDISKGVILKSVSNCHDSKVVKLQIVHSISDSSSVRYSNQNNENSSSDMTIISVDSKGGVYRMRFNKVLWTSFTSETDCLLDGSSGMICDMKCCKPINEIGIPIESYGSLQKGIKSEIKLMHPYQNKLSALSTKSKTYIIQVYPVIRILFRWPISDNFIKSDLLKSPSLISLDWGYKVYGNADARKADIVLFRSFSSCIQMLTIKSTFDLLQVNDVRETYDFILEHQRDLEKFSIVKINVISDSQLLVLTLTDVLLLSYSLDILTIFPYGIDDLKNSIQNFPNKTSLIHSIPNFISGVGRSVYIVDTDSVYKIHSQLWTEKLEKYISEGKWLECLSSILQNYEINSQDLSDSSLDYVVVYLKKYLNLTFSQSLVSSNNPIKYSSNYGLIASVCIEMCSSLNRLDFLFEFVYDTFKAASQRNLFFQSLIPYILTRKVTNVPPDILIDFIEYCDRCHRLSTVERCLSYLDTTNMDLNAILRFLLDNKMYSTFLYVYGYGLVDFVGAFQIVFNIILGCGNNDFPNSVTSLQVELSYKLILFYKYSIEGLIYPRKEVTTIPSEWVCKLTELILCKYFQSDLTSVANLIKQVSYNINIEYPILTVLFKVDCYATIYYVCKGIDLIQQSSSLSNQPLRVYNIYENLFLCINQNSHMSEAFYSCCSSILSTCQNVLPIKMLSGFINYLKLTLLNNFSCSTYISYEDILINIVNNQMNSYRGNGFQTSVSSDHLMQLQQFLESKGFYQSSLELLKYNKSINISNFCQCALKLYIDMVLPSKSEVDQNVYLFNSQSNNVRLNLESSNSQIIFKFLDRLYNYYQNSDKTLDIINKVIINHLITLCDIDIEKTQLFSCEYLFNKFSDIYLTLQNHSNYQFIICKGIINKLLSIESVSILDYISSHDIVNYVKILLAHSPYDVFKFVIRFENIPLDECIQLCKDANALDSASVLVEKTGDLNQSLDLLVIELGHRLNKVRIYIDDLLKSKVNGKNLTSKLAKIESDDSDTKLMHMILVGTSSSRKDMIMKLSFFHMLLHVITCMTDLCYRHSDKTNTILWFNSFDNILKERNKFNQGILSSTSEIMSLIIGVLIQIMVSNMKDYVSSHEIIRRVTQSYSRSKYVEFKDVIHNMTASYKFDEWILSSTKNILVNDVNSLLYDKFKMTKRGVRHDILNSQNNSERSEYIQFKSNLIERKNNVYELKTYLKFQESLLKQRHILLSLSPPVFICQNNETSETRQPGSLPKEPNCYNAFDMEIYDN